MKKTHLGVLIFSNVTGRWSHEILFDKLVNLARNTNIYIENWPKGHKPDNNIYVMGSVVIAVRQITQESGKYHCTMHTETTLCEYNKGDQ